MPSASLVGGAVAILWFRTANVRWARSAADPRGAWDSGKTSLRRWHWRVAVRNRKQVGRHMVIDSAAPKTRDTPPHPPPPPNTGIPTR